MSYLLSKEVAGATYIFAQGAWCAVFWEKGADKRLINRLVFREGGVVGPDYGVNSRIYVPYSLNALAQGVNTRDPHLSHGGLGLACGCGLFDGRPAHQKPYLCQQPIELVTCTLACVFVFFFRSWFVLQGEGPPRRLPIEKAFR